VQAAGLTTYGMHPAERQMVLRIQGCRAALAVPDRASQASVGEYRRAITPRRHEL
jgi:hypothetical protein